MKIKLFYGSLTRAFQIAILISSSLLNSCGLDDIDLTLPSVWVSVNGGSITIHNDSGSSLVISSWKLTEWLNSGSQKDYIIPGNTQITGGGSKVYNGSAWDLA